MKLSIPTALLLCTAWLAPAYAQAPSANNETYGNPGTGSLTSHGGSHILFLNRCASGCVVNPGANDSRTNTSSIVDATSTLTAFPHGATAWNQTVACVTELYADFDLEVTDVDPGATTPHFEVMVAGTAAEIGLTVELNGVAPASCTPQENGISYAFGGTLPNDPQVLCDITARQGALLFGLESEYQCEDVMSVLTECGAKSFTDQAVQCGSFSPSDCSCGGTTQNSYQHLMDLFGPSDPTGAPDAGTAGTPDAGTAGTPDAGTAGTPDAGTAGTPDAGTAGSPDAGTGTGDDDDGDGGCGCAATTGSSPWWTGLALLLLVFAVLRARRSARQRY